MRYIFHIGPMKTGSTTIQQQLDSNRKNLADQGFFVGSPQNKSPLVGICKKWRNNLDLADNQKDFLGRLRSSFPENWGDFHTIVVSAEIIGQAMRTPTEVRDLYAYIQDLYGVKASFTPRVIAYLRRQDEVAISMLSTLARHGKTVDFNSVKPLRYSNMLSAWLDVAKRHDINAVRYAKSEWKNSSLVDDFFYRIDPKLRFDHHLGKQAQNTSINSVGIAILSEVADFIREKCPTFDFKRNKDWRELVKSIESLCSGKPEIPSSEELSRYMAKVNVDNKIVENDWICDGMPLFTYKDVKNITPQEELTPTQIQLICTSALASLIRSGTS